MTLDLSKAIWEGTRAIRAIPNYAEDATTSDMAAAAIRAALPHIIEALAERAEADKAAAAERFRTAPTATERVDASQWGDVCELAAVYLRARTEEARRG